MNDNIQNEENGVNNNAMEEQLNTVNTDANVISNESTTTEVPTPNDTNTSENQVNVMQTNNVDNDFKDAAPKKSHKILPIIFVIILIALLAAGYLFYNSKSTAARSINDIRTNLKDIFASNLIKDDEYDKILSADSYTMNSDIKLSSMIGNINFKADSIIDNKNGLSSSNISILNENDEILKFKAILNDNKIYMKLDKFMDMYYYLENSFTNSDIDISSITNLLNIKLENTIDVICDDINNSLKSTKVKNELATLNLNGNDKKVRKIIFSYTQKDFNKLITNILTDFKKENVLNELTSLLSMPKDEIKVMLDNAINEITVDDADNNDTIFNYIIYSDILLNKIVGWELSDEEAYIKITDVEDKLEMNLVSLNTDDKNEKFSLKINLDEKDNQEDTSIVFINEGQEILKINGYFKETGDFDYDIKAADYKFNVFGKYNKKDENDSIKENLTLSFKMLGTQIFKLDMETNTLAGGSINLDEIKNAKSLTEMNEKEQAEILNKIQSDKKIQQFVISIMGEAEGLLPTIGNLF